MQQTSIPQMSLSEVIRSISAITKRNIDSVALFDKAEFMDEIVWQLLEVFFDSSLRNFHRLGFMKLLNLAVDALNFPSPFFICDFEDKRDKRKWIAFLSYLLFYLEQLSRGSQATIIYNEAKQAKVDYITLTENLKSHEQIYHEHQQAEQVQRDRLSKLEQRLNELKSQINANKNIVSNSEANLQSILNATHETNEQIKYLTTQIETLQIDYENTSKILIKDCDTFPDAIAQLKNLLDSNESEMHRLYEKRTFIVVRTTEFQTYESLLDSHIKNSMDQLLIYMNKFAESQKQEKELQCKLEELKNNLNKLTKEEEEFQQSFVDHRNQLMRKKLLLNNKKKAHEADMTKKTKENESLHSEYESIKTRFDRKRKDKSAIEHQSDLEKEKSRHCHRDQVHISKVCELLTQLNREFNSNITL